MLSLKERIYLYEEVLKGNIVKTPSLDRVDCEWFNFVAGLDNKFIVIDYEHEFTLRLDKEIARKNITKK